MATPHISLVLIIAELKKLTTPTNHSIIYHNIKGGATNVLIYSYADPLIYMYTAIAKWLVVVVVSSLQAVQVLKPHSRLAGFALVGVPAMA